MSLICIAIDGTAASGKSSTALKVAKELGYRHLSTGFLYRALALGLQRAGLRVDNRAEIRNFLAQDPLCLRQAGLSYHIYLKGALLDTSLLEQPEITRISAPISAVADVRAYLLPLQRALVERKGLVLEGRDIGTVVLPEAELKVFLSAPVALRAQRRLGQMQAAGLPSTAQEIEKSLRLRDKQDTERSLSPLRAAPGARHINSAQHTESEQVNIILNWARQCMSVISSAE